MCAPPRGRIGADGLAFWYVRENNQLGGVFGSKNEWDGLGVFFDTYDNDAKVSSARIVRALCRVRESASPGIRAKSIASRWCILFLNAFAPVPRDPTRATWSHSPDSCRTVPPDPRHLFIC